MDKTGISIGLLTYMSEGNDNPDSMFFSRKIHHPNTASGVKSGRGAENAKVYEITKFLVVLLLTFFSGSTIASSINDYNSLDKLKKLDAVSCQGVKESDGYSGLAWCIDRVYVESNEKIKKRVEEYKTILKRSDDKKYLLAFESAQKAWAEYKVKQCSWETISTVKNSDAYNYLNSLCGLTENYNRLSSLKVDPAIP